MGRIELNSTPDFYEKEDHSGTLGWLALGGFVLAWDVLAPETLSGAVDRALENPKTKILATIGVLATGAHLLNLIPDEIDPFYKAFDFLDAVRDKAGVYVQSKLDG